MKPDVALQFFKTREALAAAAHCTRQAVSRWFKQEIVPRRSAELLAAASAGALKVDEALYS